MVLLTFHNPVRTGATTAGKVSKILFNYQLTKILLTFQEHEASYVTSDPDGF
jgi:hypothetical protein